jgi:acetyl coenzyme A synthetase (ADP forming)-like protein
MFDIVLRDGSTLHVRAARPDDAAGLRALEERRVPERTYYRLPSVLKHDLIDPARLAALDPDEEFLLVGESGGRVSAAAGYLRDPAAPERAEVSFAIAAALQGRGVGTRMLEILASTAREHGVRWFDAYVLEDNQRMMNMLLDSGFEVDRRLGVGVCRVVLSLAPTADLATRSAERSEEAAAASMKSFFEPKSVAVVGANRERGKIGAEVLQNLVDGGYTGRLAAVHPSARNIRGVPAYRRVGDVPGDVELAIVAVPADRVGGVVDDCVAKNVKAIVVISAGFAETGPAGREREADLLGRVRKAGIRLVGPNCMGLINTDPGVRLNATFAPVSPPAGSVGMSTQSGALGVAILEYARRLDIGFSTFVSVGNKADVSSNDLVQYWANDPRTRVILLYVESFGNPHKFSQIARRVGRRKPIVAVKAGRSTAGARAASSHTGALATNDVIVDALFRQAGVIRTNTLEELFDVARVLAHQPVPSGRRVAILTNAGGPGILAADACAAHGLELAALSDATTSALRSFLPAAASIGNPVDMIASATADQYDRALEILLRDDGVDSVLVVFVPPLATRTEDVARAVRRVALARPGKTVLGIFMPVEGAAAVARPVPCFMFPEAAAVALARAATYGEWMRAPEGLVPEYGDIDGPAIRGVVGGALARGGGWLTPAEATAIVSAAGVGVAASRLAGTADEAVAAADAIGYPVVLKAIGPRIVHKTEIGGVIVGLADGAAVRRAWNDLSARLPELMTGGLVQEMVSGGVEMLVGATEDPTFGPLVACAMGGTLADLLTDSQFRLHPLTDRDVASMINGLRGVVLLGGYRGAPPADEKALADAMLRLSALIGLCPEIAEMDVNPLVVLQRGVRALDVRIRIERPRLRPPTRRVAY